LIKGGSGSNAYRTGYQESQQELAITQQLYSPTPGLIGLSPSSLASWEMDFCGEKKLITTTKIHHNIQDIWTHASHWWAMISMST